MKQLPKMLFISLTIIVELIKMTKLFQLNFNFVLCFIDIIWENTFLIPLSSLPSLPSFLSLSFTSVISIYTFFNILPIIFTLAFGHFLCWFLKAFLGIKKFSHYFPARKLPKKSKKKFSHCDTSCKHFLFCNLPFDYFRVLFLVVLFCHAEKMFDFLVVKFFPLLWLMGIISQLQRLCPCKYYFKIYILEHFYGYILTITYNIYLFMC